MKLLKEKYKTWEGAHKRAAFENGIAPGEFARGDKAKLYRYRVVQQGGIYRVERVKSQPAEKQRNYLDPFDPRYADSAERKASLKKGAI